MNDGQTINLLKGLVIDGVDKAASGHPGGAMSSMDFAYILFTEYLNFDPDDPTWLGRDRFILSAGHESMLQYAFLYAIGWLESADLKQFRQLDSRTPGHPENFMTPGVECTTGPLGQGCAMSVGFAIAASHLQARLDGKLFSNHTYALMGDGCMQECVTLGSASLAGHLRLGNLIWYYDKNRQQISGDISRAYSDDEAKVFAGFGWQVLSIDGHDHTAIRNAIATAQAEKNRPTLIIGQTTMAKGAATMEGSHETHGAPLPAAEKEATKKSLGIPSGESFYWPEAAAKHFQRRFPELRQQSRAWRDALANFQGDSARAKLWATYFGASDDASQTPSKGHRGHKNVGAAKGRKNVGASLPAIPWDKGQAMATRNAFGRLLADWAEALPQLVGGSADLEPSNMTEAFAKKVKDFSAVNRAGRNLAYGVREFPMSAVSNGLALYGGLIPFDATFLTFADYSRPALRLGAIQKARVIHEFTHDSFYLGEDGPTHQPIEHIMSLRSMPDLYLMRPADPLETEVLMRTALDLEAPSCFCLTRQKVPYLPVAASEVKAAQQGAWVVRQAKNADLILFASGSEVGLALKVAEALANQRGGQKGEHSSGPKSRWQDVRVVSVPCWELFFASPRAYQNEVLSWNIRCRVSIEAGSTLGWERFVGAQGLTIGIDHYGASGPAQDLERAFGFTVEQVVAKILAHPFEL